MPAAELPLVPVAVLELDPELAVEPEDEPLVACVSTYPPPARDADEPALELPVLPAPVLGLVLLLPEALLDSRQPVSVTL